MHRSIHSSRRCLLARRALLARLRAFLFCLLGLMPALAHAAPIKVVATVPALASLARDIGGDRVEVTSLSLATQDPHFVDARPSLALALNRADLLLVVGLELELGWLPTLLTGARNPRVQVGGPGYVDCSMAAMLRGVITGPIDRAHGDVHAGGNPHYLFDPHNALRVGKLIAERLSAIDPEGSAIYAANERAFAESLNRRVADWQARLKPLKGRPIIAYHSSWLYLAEWIGLREVAFIEPRPGIAPTPSHVARVIATGRAEGVRAILQETFYADSTSRLIADKLGAKLLRLDGGPNTRRGESYADHMERVVTALIEAMAPAVQSSKEARP